MSQKPADPIQEEKAERAATAYVSPLLVNQDISSLDAHVQKLVQQYETKLSRNDTELRTLRAQVRDSDEQQALISRLQTDCEKLDIQNRELHKECDRLLRQNQLDRQFAMEQEGELQAALNKLQLQYDISLSITSDLMLRIMKAKGD